MSRALDQLTQMMQGDSNWREIAQGLHVRYLFWGQREELAYPDSAKPWRNLPIVASGDWGAIYDIAPPPLPVSLK